MEKHFQNRIVKSSVNMKSGSTSSVIKEVLIKTTMTKPSGGRIWSEEAAYLLLVTVNQYNHFGKQFDNIYSS